MNRNLNRKLKWNNKFCIVLIVLAFVLGLAVSNDYGTYWDQFTEERILMQNMYEYMSYFPNSGWEDIISLSAERDHGVAPYYPLGIYWLCRILSPGSMDFPAGTSALWHYYTFFLFFLGCLAFYGIVYELFRSHKLSLVCFFLCYLSPRFFAEGHYNNKDIVMLTLSLLCVYFGIRYIREQKLRHGLFLALSAAFMTNVKILGAWFFAVPGIVYLIVNIRKRRVSGSKVMDGINVILAYFIVYAAITPAPWKEGIGFLEYCLSNASSFSRWGGMVVYAGKSFLLPDDPVPKDYLALNILYTTPLLLLFFSLVGHIRAVAAMVRKEKETPFYAMILLLNLVPFLYSLMNKNLVIYNGWRHFYFLYGGILIFAAVGLKAILSCLKSRPLRYAVCAGSLTWLLCLVVMGHPFQYSYLNLLAKRPAEGNWQLDYWNVGGIPVLTRLYESGERDRNLDLTVTGLGPLEFDLKYVCQWGEAVRYLSSEEIRESGIPANYVICNTTFDTPPEEGYHLLFETGAYGSCLYRVYEIDL